MTLRRLAALTAVDLAVSIAALIWAGRRTWGN